MCLFHVFYFKFWIGDFLHSAINYQKIANNKREFIQKYFRCVYFWSSPRAAFGSILDHTNHFAHAEIFHKGTHVK